MGGLDRLTLKDSSRESLLNGKDQYSLPPYINYLRSAPFFIEIKLFFFDKTTYLNEEVNCTAPFPLVRVPWFKLQV